MTHESPQLDLIRLLVAEIWFGLSMKAARELYGRSYFSLGAIEKFALDQTVGVIVASNYCAIATQPIRPKGTQIRGFRPLPDTEYEQ